jgi:hypothetical protein
MKRTDVLLVICMAAAPGAASALGAQTIVQPAAPLDAGRVRLRDAMVTLRDSLITINGAAARLQRDYRTTSDAALTARAREIVRACARSIAVLPATREVVAAADAPAGARRRTQAGVLRALDSLQTTLTGCGTVFGELSRPGKGEEVRGYGNRRAEPILRALGDYDSAARNFFMAWGIDVRPIGARPSPMAG